MQLIEFPDSMDDDAKLQILFAFHNFERYVEIDEEDKPMVIMALNQTDVASVERDDEGGLVIKYHGDEWEQNEQRTI
jgi:hypothetical protein